MFEINLLGRFQMRKGSKVLDEESMRSSQLVKLLSFMILHRGNELSIQDMAEALWQEEESDNPAGALKNLIYRLRSILKETFGGEEWILTGKGAYYVNPKLKMKVDVEELEAVYRKIKKNREHGTSLLTDYERVIQLYRGEFLTGFSHMSWVMPLSSYYHSLFLDIIKDLIALHQKNKRYQEMEQVCTKALFYDTCDEQLHAYMIKALVYQQKTEMALTYYHKSRSLLEEQLGTKRLDKVKEAYQEIRRIQNIREKERIPEILFTISLGNSSLRESTMEQLEEISRSSLRGSDIIVRQNDTQLAIVLPTCNYRESVRIAKRIQDRISPIINQDLISIEVDVKEVDGWIGNCEIPEMQSYSTPSTLSLRTRT